MRPTPLAEALQPRIRRIAADIEDIVVSNVEFDPEYADKSLRILATDYASLVRVQPLMAAMATEAPNVPRPPSTQSHRRARHAPAANRSRDHPERAANTAGLPNETLFTDRFVAPTGATTAISRNC